MSSISREERREPFPDGCALDGRVAPLDLEPPEEARSVPERDAAGRLDEREAGLVLRERLVVPGHASRLDHPSGIASAGGEHVEDRASQVVALTERQEPARVGGHSEARRGRERRRRAGLAQAESLQRARVGDEARQRRERSIPRLLRPCLRGAPGGQRVADRGVALERQQEVGRLDARKREEAVVA